MTTVAESSPSHPRPSPPRPIHPRKMDFPFATSNIPRHWFAGSVFATHLANGLNLLFPAGERFFVRSVRAFIDQIDDPQLLADVRGFAGQEARHGLEHERFNEVLEQQGFKVRAFLATYDKLAWSVLEPRFSPKMCLSVTVALEHFTATFAENAFESGVLEEHVHPTMRDLLMWHAAEEIEHKAVAFDVLKKVDPSYALRIGGIVLATAGLVPFWIAGATMLLRQEPKLSWKRLARERREAKKRGQIGPRTIARAFLRYLRPDFHPSQTDTYGVAKAYFERIETPAVN